jgi:broad specificity phosphatase PhoE
MSTLTVVRHGQARPFQDNPDRLSETGERQARALAEYWARNGIAFDEVWSGSLNRHRQTAELAAGPFQTGLAQIDADWDEYDAAGILRDYPPPSSYPDNRVFQKMFEGAMRKWMEHPEDHCESWVAFRERVLRGLRRMQAGPAGRNVVLFTSGGPIGVLVQTALSAPERSFREINWRVRNCSITEFVFSSERLSLDSFNATPHLEDRTLQTFR